MSRKTKTEMILRCIKRHLRAVEDDMNDGGCPTDIINNTIKAQKLLEDLQREKWDTAAGLDDLAAGLKLIHDDVTAIIDDAVTEGDRAVRRFVADAIKNSLELLDELEVPS